MRKRRHPDWLKVSYVRGEKYSEIKRLLRNSKLSTICEEAKCPNIVECFNNRTAVLLILGDICTRNCRYCNVKHGKPEPIDYNEPKNVAESVRKIGLKYVVLTSVTRDDLEDGGADVFYNCVNQIKKINKNCLIELLIPDFNGKVNSLKRVIESSPFVINHNIEVTEELFSEIRPEGSYNRSLNLLKKIKEIDNTINTKSGFMIGLGENKDQIIKTIHDIKKAGVDFLTIGQYLQPSINHFEVKKYYRPEEFEDFKKIAIDIGFKHVESGPLVRSSYHANKVVIN